MDGSLTPRGSPPPSSTMRADTPEQSPSTRKTSHGGLMGPPQTPASHIIVPDMTTRAHQERAQSVASVEAADEEDGAPLPTMSTHSTQRSSMPEALSSNTKPPPSAQVGRDSQSSPPSSSGYASPAKDTSAANSGHDRDAPHRTDRESTPSPDPKRARPLEEDIGLPEDSLPGFDWPALEQSYHNMIKTKGEEEDRIWAEFQTLSDFFGVWASTSHTHEVDRSFKRLKTQEVYVQKQEKELEARRQYYTNVVDAFRSALLLLEA